MEKKRVNREMTDRQVLLACTRTQAIGEYIDDLVEAM